MYDIYAVSLGYLILSKVKNPIEKCTTDYENENASTSLSSLSRITKTTILHVGWIILRVTQNCGLFLNHYVSSKETEND